MDPYQSDIVVYTGPTDEVISKPNARKFVQSYVNEVLEYFYVVKHNPLKLALKLIAAYIFEISIMYIAVVGLIQG